MKGWPILLAAALAWGGCSEAPESPASAPAASTRAADADVRLAGIEAINAEMRARRGKGLLVNHWATW